MPYGDARRIKVNTLIELGINSLLKKSIDCVCDRIDSTPRYPDSSVNRMPITRDSGEGKIPQFCD